MTAPPLLKLFLAGMSRNSMPWPIISFQVEGSRIGETMAIIRCIFRVVSAFCVGCNRFRKGVHRVRFFDSKESSTLDMVSTQKGA